MNVLPEVAEHRRLSIVVYLLRYYQFIFCYFSLLVDSQLQLKLKCFSTGLWENNVAWRHWLFFYSVLWFQVKDYLASKFCAIQIVLHHRCIESGSMSLQCKYVSNIRA
jgi:hypothetical protein